MTPVELLLALNNIPDASVDDVIQGLVHHRSEVDALEEISALFAHRFFDPFAIDTCVTQNGVWAERYNGLLQRCWFELVGGAGLQRPWRDANPYGMEQIEPEVQDTVVRWLDYGLRAEFRGKDRSRQTPVVFQTMLDWAEHYPWTYDPILACAIQHPVWPADMLERLCALPRSIGPIALSAMAEYALRGAPYPLPASYRCAPSLGHALVLVNEQSALVRELYSEEWSKNISRYVPIVVAHLHAMLDEPGAYARPIDLPSLES